MNDKIMERKRIRGSNFTPEEELELIQNIVNYQHIIESKELNSSTRNEKDAAWAQIGQIFNSKFSPRTVHQLRSKYDNMKTIARRLVSDKRNNVISINTFSPNNNIRTNIAMNIVLNIINRKADNSLDNIVSCNPEDVQFSEESSSYSDNSSKPLQQMSDFEIKVKEEDTYYEKPENIIQKPVTNTLIINTPAEINKNIEKHKNLILSTVIPPPKTEDIQEKEPEINNSVALKKRNPRLQELLKVKTEYLKRRLEFIKLENEERIKRIKREEEIYAMKMKILELDACIKEEELKKLKNM